MPDNSTIYTIGHSNHQLSRFVSLLKTHHITAVADVRSHPASRFEHFRKENLQRRLREHDVQYVFLGRELGARREELECYIDGRVDFQLAAKLKAFNDGIGRLERGGREHAIALMCAEREPLDCHRTVLVARRLAERGWRIEHIFADGSLEPHDETERRMIEVTGSDPLFDARLTHEELLERAYAERGRQIAYRRPNHGDTR